MTKLYSILFETKLNPEEELFEDLKTYVEEEIIPLAFKSGFRLPTQEETTKNYWDHQWVPANERREWKLLHAEVDKLILTILLLRDNPKSRDRQQSVNLYVSLNGIEFPSMRDVNVYISPNHSLLDQLEHKQVQQKFLSLLSKVPEAAENIRKWEEEEIKWKKDELEQ